MSTDDLIARLTAAARAQHGLIRLNQFPSSEHGSIRHMARRGIIERVGRGVFRVSGAPATWMQSLQAGTWALGDRSTISHGAAARLYRCDLFDNAPAEFSVPRLQRGRKLIALGATVHTTTSPLNGDVRRV